MSARKTPRTRPEPVSSMAQASRPTLAPSVERLYTGAPQPAPPADSQTHGVTESQSPVRRDPGSGTAPRYLTLVRKEARLRADQAAALAELRRRVARSRKDRTETLTDNSLIRVAVDLLLAHAEDLRGDTEAQLLDSVTHRLPE